MRQQLTVTAIGVFAAAAVLAAAVGLVPPAVQAVQQPPPPVVQQPTPPTPQQPTPVFRGGVKLVRVDVAVTGRNDQAVTDLQVPEFEVTEDGVLQKVEQLRFVRLDGHRPQGDEESLEIRSQEQAEAEAAREDVRVFVIFFDDYHIDKLPSVTIPMRRALKDFIQRLWPTDLVAIMDPLTTLDGLKFTRSKRELLDAVEKFEGRQGEYTPIRSVLEEAQLQTDNPRRMRAEVTMSALAGLCIKLGGLREGRKTVIFVSQGPPTFTAYGQSNLQENMREIFDAANRGNVTIDPVDPQSLGMSIREDPRSTLYQLAAETGGRAVVNTNAMELGMARVLEETSAYYVLGYTPTRATDDGKYHKIGVKVRRPGVQVLARQGYWAPSTKEMEAAVAAASKPLPPGVAEAREALSKAEPGRRPVDLWVGLARADGNKAHVTVAWDAPGVPHPLPVVKLEVEVAPAKGGPPVVPAAVLAIDSPAKRDRPMAVFTLDPGEYEVRLTARTTDNSVADRWGQALSVPDLATAPVALATPRLYRAQSLAEFRTIRAAREPVPTVVRQFARADRVLVDVECYVAKANDSAQIVAHVMSRDGRELTALPVPELVNGRARFELPVGSLGQGMYLLRVRARNGTAEAESLTAFRVVP